MKTLNVLKIGSLVLAGAGLVIGKVIDEKNNEQLKADIIKELSEK